MSNRIIRENWFFDETMAELNDFEFRLYAAVLVKADDYGRYYSNPRIVATCLPLRAETEPARVEAALRHMAELGLLTLYRAKGNGYLELTRWGEGQSVRNKRSKYPAPSEGEVQELVSEEAAHDAQEAAVSVERGRAMPAPTARTAHKYIDDLASLGERIPTHQEPGLRPVAHWMAPAGAHATPVCGLVRNDKMGRFLSFNRHGCENYNSSVTARP